MTDAAVGNEFHDRVLGCFLGGWVGDAMGTPTENMEYEDIARRFGWVTSVSGDGTDDSAMRALLCKTLLATGGYAGPDDWAEQWIADRDVFTGTLRPRFFVSVLHTAAKLAMGYDSRSVATGNMASSSSAMCIAPVGIVNAGNPRAAASQAWSLGSLIHQGPVSFCADAAAAVAAAVAIAVVPGASLDDVLDGAGATLHSHYGAVMRDLIAQALTLADGEPSYEAFRATFHRTFRQTVACDSRETVPAVFGLLAVAQGDPQRSVESAANFGRDTDTIGAMIGAISGALAGGRALTDVWGTSIGDARLESERRLSAEMASLAISKASGERELSSAALARISAVPIRP